MAVINNKLIIHFLYANFFFFSFDYGVKYDPRCFHEIHMGVFILSQIKHLPEIKWFVHYIL